jgi:hypothetical protein
LQCQFAHWCFNYISRITNWVRLKFGQKINDIIIILHKKFQKNPHHRFGFMIKSVKAVATGNEFAAKFQRLSPVRSASSQCQKEKTSKTTFSSFKQDENPHGVPDGPKAVVDVDKSERECLQPIQATTLLLN